MVLPSGQPDRIFLYEPEFPPTIAANSGTRETPTPAMKRIRDLLAQSAVRAGKADDLRHRLEQRKVIPSDNPSLILIFSAITKAETAESPR